MNLKFAMYILCLLLLLPGCAGNENPIKNTEPKNIVTGEVIFRAYVGSNPLPGVTIVVIDYNGKVIGKVVTGNRGESKKG